MFYVSGPYGYTGDCSPACGWCNACDSRYSKSKRGKGHLTRADMQAIREGFLAAGLPRDYFDFYDVCYLADQGKSINEIVLAAIDHHDKEVRLNRGRDNA